MFVKFPNGKVWRLDKGRFKGTVLVPGSENIGETNLETFLDAISEEATGSSALLVDIAYQNRGGDLISFSGHAVQEYLEYNVDEGGPIFEVFPRSSDDLKLALMQQYRFSETEAAHAIAALDKNYGKESQVDILGSAMQICSPAYPKPCSYVRILVDGYEIAYWASDEWRNAPEGLLGAIFRTVTGRQM